MFLNIFRDKEVRTYIFKTKCPLIECKPKHYSFDEILRE